MKNGAIGVLMIQPPGRQSPAPSVPFSGKNLGFGRPNMTLGAEPAVVPVFNLADPVRDLLVSSLGLVADSKAHPVEGGNLRVRFRYAASKEVKSDRNVVGFFPGSDSQKQKEVIVFSAHYDHVGVNDKGEIFNGSDDNGSGTSTLLEIAQAFGQGPRPREAWLSFGSRARRKGSWAATGSPTI